MGVNEEKRKRKKEGVEKGGKDEPSPGLALNLSLGDQCLNY